MSEPDELILWNPQLPVTPGLLLRWWWTALRLRRPRLALVDIEGDGYPIRPGCRLVMIDATVGR